jgi:hypothetical protein
MLLFAIVTEYTLWLFPLCLALAAAYTWLLYRNEQTFVSAALWLQRLMIAFRFIVVSIIAFLLLSPFFQSSEKTIEKPIIIVARDNSESIIFNKDSSFYRNAFQQKMKALTNKLSAQFTVKELCFDSKTFDSNQCSYKGKATDFSELFSHISKTYANYNLGAVVIASDGIYNRGASPTFAADSKEIKAPIYTIAMGDTIAPRDLAITSVKHNQISFEGDAVPVEMQLKAFHLKNESTKLLVKEGDNEVFSKTISFSTDEHFLSIPMELKPEKAGIHHYRIETTHNKNEITYLNNTKDFVIEVLKNKQKILIVYNSPNPDIGALKRSLETNANYSIEEKSIDETNTVKVSDYNLVILSQLPSKMNAATTLAQSILTENIPLLLLCGTQTDLQKVNAMFPGLVSINRNMGFDEAQMKISSSFPLFEIDEDEKNFLEQCTPLTVPFANFNASNATVFSTQKINSIETDKPLLLFLNRNETKTAILLGEGIWKWRLSSYKTSVNFKPFDSFISKIASYLALNFKKTKFVTTASRIFQENEAISIDAELYNDSYELINTPDVAIEIINAKGHHFPFTFSKTSKAYNLNAGIFPQGDYSFVASVKQGDKTVTSSGAFTVLPINIESENIVAKHNELFALSENHGGKMFLPSETDKLADELLKNNDIKPISHFDKAMKEMVDFPLLFLFLLLLISAEWFLRKYHGGY